MPKENRTWPPGKVPIAVVMISLNEGHNLRVVLENLKGWAQEVFLVDSLSQDDTIDIALQYGIHVVQRKFVGFGDQWNFALEQLPISSRWTMKLDPDERLTSELKLALEEKIKLNDSDGILVDRRLWFMDKPLPVQQQILRLWRTGTCRFTDIAVNEHPIVNGRISKVRGELIHCDSPDLEHWIEKQNRYTTAEAIIKSQNMPLAARPIFMGSQLERRMWMKKNFSKLPLRYFWLFSYYWVIQGSWRAGWVGYAWSRLKVDIMRLIEYKAKEIRLTKRLPSKRKYGPGKQDLRIQQYD